MSPKRPSDRRKRTKSVGAFRGKEMFSRKVRPIPHLTSNTRTETGDRRKGPIEQRKIESPTETKRIAGFRGWDPCGLGTYKEVTKPSGQKITERRKSKYRGRRKTD